MDAVVIELARATGAWEVTLRLLTDDLTALRRVATAGTADPEARPPELIAIDEGMAGWAMSHEEIAVSNDYRKDRRAARSLVDKGTRSAVAIPITIMGRSLGVLIVAAQEPDQFPDPRVAYLTAVVTTLTPLLENARIQEEESARRQELEALYGMAYALAGVEPISERIQGAVAKLTDVFGGVNFTFWQSTKEDDGLRLVARAGPHAVLVAETKGFMKTGEGVFGSAHRERHVVIANDYSGDPRAASFGLRANIGSAAAFPIVVNDRVLAVLGASSEQLDFFTELRVRVLSAVTAGLGALVENANLADQFKVLTGGLGPRAIEIISLAAQGLTNRMIARRLGISENTVKYHMKKIMAELHLHSRTQLR